tara:strand:- start:4394 stop:4759 length:366 start_codon:yes stop_codon:yes gene_type:complete
MKSISWRFVGTLDTLLLSWLISGSFSFGLQISAIDFIAKIILYYYHEVFWSKFTSFKIGLKHLYKTISWRFIGTLSTLIIAWIVTGNPLIGFKISVVEFFTKMLLYYIHEKVWFKIKYGLK